MYFDSDEIQAPDVIQATWIFWRWLVFWIAYKYLSLLKWKLFKIINFNIQKRSCTSLKMTFFYSSLRQHKWLVVGLHEVSESSPNKNEHNKWNQVNITVCESENQKPFCKNGIRIQNGPLQVFLMTIIFRNSSKIKYFSKLVSKKVLI